MPGGSPRPLGRDGAAGGTAPDLLTSRRSGALTTGEIVEQFLTMIGARVLVLLAALCFATTGTAQELGPDGLEPIAVGAARIAVGGALLALFAWWLGRRRPTAKPAREMAPAALGAIAVAVAVYQLSFFASVRLTGVAVGTVVALGSAPAFAGIAGRLAGDGPLGRRWAISTALACTGVALLVVAGAGATEIDPLGIGLALVSGQRLRDLHRRLQAPAVGRPRARAGDGVRLRRGRAAALAGARTGRRRRAADPRRPQSRPLPGVDPYGARVHPVRPRPQADQRGGDGHADARRAAHGRRPRRAGPRRAAGRARGGRRGDHACRTRGARAAGPGAVPAAPRARLRLCDDGARHVLARRARGGLDRRRAGQRAAAADPRRRPAGRRAPGRARADRALRRRPPQPAGGAEEPGRGGAGRGRAQPRRSRDDADARGPPRALRAARGARARGRASDARAPRPRSERGAHGRQ